MTASTIVSRANALVRRARAIRDGRETGMMFIEGVRLAEEALRSRLTVETALYTERANRNERGHEIIAALRLAGATTVAVSEPVMASVSSTRTPQGVVLLAARVESGRDVLERVEAGSPLLPILHQIGSPGNAGAILRTAEAAGASGAIVTAGSADVFSPSGLRGAMGAVFRLPLWTGPSFDVALAWCAARRITAVFSSPRSSKQYTEVDWTRRIAVAFGSEAHGLKEPVGEHESVSIPMRPPVESLNAGVAAAILLYEAARQRSAGTRVRCGTTGSTGST